MWTQPRAGGARQCWTSVVRNRRGGLQGPLTFAASLSCSPTRTPIAPHPGETAAACPRRSGRRTWRPRASRPVRAVSPEPLRTWPALRTKSAAVAASGAGPTPQTGKVRHRGPHDGSRSTTRPAQSDLPRQSRTPRQHTSAWAISRFTPTTRSLSRSQQQRNAGVRSDASCSPPVTFTEPLWYSEFHAGAQRS